ncbi:MAG TPA: hypothetical protein VJL58_03300 [Pyrinomonadaceae bacterium]|nr:hypothetical protein [Pyrinomonadaceae bacterium]
MKRFRLHASLYALVAAVILGAVGTAEAQRRNERDVRDIVRSLNSKIDDFKFGIDYQLRSSSANRRDIDELTRSIGTLQSRVDAFDENFQSRRENRDDVSDIVNAAKDVDSFIRTNRQNQRIETDWFEVRDLIGRLAANYGVTPDWSGGAYNYPAAPSRRRGNYPVNTPGGSMDNGLTGTYQLDVGRSERVADVIANTRASGSQRQDLESKLEAPSQIALLVRGDEVTLASSNAQPASFRADGGEKLETIDGRDVRLRATLRGNNDLTITSVGGATDYTVTFTSADNGRTLKVTRRITTDYLSETVFAESVYTKTDAVAGLGIDANAPIDNGSYSSNDPRDNRGYPTVGSGRTGDFIVPNGTAVTAILENEINTKVSQNNDKFRMTVQSPDEFRGATIEGYISGVGRSGQVSGRSNVTFNFERITLRNGQSYEFSGVLQAVKDQNGKVVKVDTEGTAKGDSQTKETAKRGGLGAGLGAIIGAIAGGGKGAVIGAIIGGGAGAGSVVVQGRDDIQLLKGSTITIQATSPVRRDQPVSEN